MEDRKLSLISSNIGGLLVKQIAHELKNYNLYMSYSNYFEVNGLFDIGKYYRKRAEEELLHHQWIMDYLTEGDCIFMYPIVPVNSERITNQIDPFNQTIDREIETTGLIYNIYDAAISEKDYMTVSWLLEKLIKEQIEEENISRAAKTIMEADIENIFTKSEKILDLIKK